jgi:hypothetical protein
MMNLAWPERSLENGRKRVFGKTDSNTVFGQAEDGPQCPCRSLREAMLFDGCQHAPAYRFGASF